MNELINRDGLNRLSGGLIGEEVIEAFAHLSPREQRIIEMRFGIRDGVTHTLEEVGKEFGVTRERVRQVEAKAMSRIKNQLKK